MLLDCVGPLGITENDVWSQESTRKTRLTKEESKSCAMADGEGTDWAYTRHAAPPREDQSDLQAESGMWEMIFKP